MESGMTQGSKMAATVAKQWLVPLAVLLFLIAIVCGVI